MSNIVIYIEANHIIALRYALPALAMTKFRDRIVKMLGWDTQLAN